MMTQNMLNNNLMNMVQPIPTPLANMQLPITYEIDKKLFYLPYVLQDERQGLFKKGPGPLGDYLIKSLKNQNRTDTSEESDKHKKKRKSYFPKKSDVIINYL